MLETNSESSLCQAHGQGPVSAHLLLRHRLDRVEHNPEPEPEPAQGEAPHPRPDHPPHLPLTLASCHLTPSSSCRPLPCSPLAPGLHRLSGQDVTDLRLLQDQRQLVMVEEVDHGVLGEQPHGQQGQARVLAREPEHNKDT